MKILLVTSRYPWPPRRGDQMRAVQMLDFLADEHEVTLLAPAPGKDQPPPPAGTRYRVELYQPGGMAIFSGMARAIVKHLPLADRALLPARPGKEAPGAGAGARPRHPPTRPPGDPCRGFRRDAVRGRPDRQPLAQFFPARGGGPLVGWRRCSRWRRGCSRWRAAAGRAAAGARRLRAGPSGARQPPAAGARGQGLVVRLSVRERKVEPPLDREKLWREGDKGPVLVMTGNLGYFVNADAVTWWLRDVWPQLRHARPGSAAGDRGRPARRRRSAGRSRSAGRG